MATKKMKQRLIKGKLYIQYYELVILNVCLVFCIKTEKS